MKKITKICTLMLTGLGLCLVSCGTNNESDNSSSKPTTSETNSSESSSSETSAKEAYKIEVAKELKLTQSFTGKTFFTDGIEECTLTRTTDGDTSTFKLKSGGSITARYLAIDTPESTAGYEKWGKAASVWNANILNKATQIVVESNASTPAKDSNGTRYLVYIWYKLEGDTEFTNLNLETVEMGYSDYTGTSSSCKYNSTFEKAKNKAKNAKMGVFGDDEDIYYPETITNVNLKELTTNASAYYDSTTQIPTRVAFDAYLVERTVSSSSFITGVVEQLVDGVAYRYTLTLGYSGATVPDMFNETALNRGTLFHISGFTSSSGLHGLEASDFFDGDQYTKEKTRFYYSNISDAVITKVEGNVITAEKNGNTFVITLIDGDSTVSSKYTVGSTISGHAYNKDNKNPDKANVGTINFDGYMSQISIKA